MTTTDEQGLLDTGTFDNASFNSVQTDSSSNIIFSIADRQEVLFDRSFLMSAVKNH